MASAGSLQQDDVVWTHEERQDFAQAIVDQAQRLNRIVGNLLDLSRIEGGSLRPDKGWYDVGALVDEVLGRLRPQTAHHTHRDRSYRTTCRLSRWTTWRSTRSCPI